MVNENTLKAVNEAIELAPKRKFTESVDLIVNLKSVDLSQPKKQDNRIHRSAERARESNENRGFCKRGSRH